MSASRVHTAILLLTICIVCLLGFSFFSTTSHSGSPQQPKQEPSVLRVVTRLVQVSVVVQDSKGRSADGLTRDDFKLFENGREQVISTFSKESFRSLSSAASPLPENSFSNRLEFRTGVPNAVTVILLDALNTRFSDQSYARQQVIKFLSQLQPKDRVALYVLTRSSVRILHDFTSDATPLLRALERYRGRTSGALDASEPVEPNTGLSDLDDFIRTGEERVANYYLADRMYSTMAGLEAIAHHLGSVPGRKNLIWVSSSFPISYGFDIERQPLNLSVERRSFYKEAERAARAISNANVAVYPVDARGLLGPFPGPNFNAAGIQTGRGPARPTVTTLSDLGNNIDSMNLIAERTGGRAFYNRNDLDVAIRKAIDESEVTYLLGYYPELAKWDGRFRELKVRVNRPGLRVRHRAGYFAGREEMPDNTTLARVMHQTARSPLDATAVGLTARLEESYPSERKLKFALAVEPRDLLLEKRESRWMGGIVVLYAQFAADGSLLDSDSRATEFKLTEESYEQLKSQGIVFHKTVDVKPDAVKLRIVVQDLPSGSIGSVSVPLAKILSPKSTTP